MYHNKNRWLQPINKKKNEQKIVIISGIKKKKKNKKRKMRKDLTVFNKSATIIEPV